MLSDNRSPNKKCQLITKLLHQLLHLRQEPHERLHVPLHAQPILHAHPHPFTQASAREQRLVLLHGRRETRQLGASRFPHRRDARQIGILVRGIVHRIGHLHHLPRRPLRARVAVLAERPARGAHRLGADFTRPGDHALHRQLLVWILRIHKAVVQHQQRVRHPRAVADQNLVLRRGRRRAARAFLRRLAIPRELERFAIRRHAVFAVGLERMVREVDARDDERARTAANLAAHRAGVRGGPRPVEVFLRGRRR